MKKGIQYSHYCGTELQNTIDLIWLAKDDLNNGNITGAKNHLSDATKDIGKLRNKIAELDRLNEMKL